MARVAVLALALFATNAAGAEAVSARIVVQHAPLAGFVYHEGKAVWQSIKPGDRLTLTREPANPHDPNAVRIEWQGHMLGYVPRADNTDIARQMDHGARVEATIAVLSRAGNWPQKSAA